MSVTDQYKTDTNYHMNYMSQMNKDIAWLRKAVDVFITIIDQLRLVMSRQHSTMRQEMCNHLILISLESDTVRALDNTALIKDFAMCKTRRTF